MRAQTMAYVVPISIAPIQSLLHQDNIGVTYVGTSNFRIKPITFVPLYVVAMPHPIITVTKAPFIKHQLILLLVSDLDHKLQGEQKL
jgi:hypothetical protein